MSGRVLHVGAGGSCLHGGQATVTPGNPRVFVGGQPVATMGDNFLVAGCTFSTPATGPHPCVRLQWSAPAARVTAMGQALITEGSSGIGVAADQAPQGPPIPGVVQSRVVAL